MRVFICDAYLIIIIAAAAIESDHPELNHNNLYAQFISIQQEQMDHFLVDAGRIAVGAVFRLDAGRRFVCGMAWQFMKLES